MNNRRQCSLSFSHTLRIPCSFTPLVLVLLLGSDSDSVASPGAERDKAWPRLAQDAIQQLNSHTQRLVVPRLSPFETAIQKHYKSLFSPSFTSLAVGYTCMRTNAPTNLLPVQLVASDTDANLPF